MRVALVCPDDLSTLIFCKGLVGYLQKDPSLQVYTVSPVDQYPQEIAALGSTHVTIEMHRFISPVQDIQYALALYRFFRRERIQAVITWTTKPNIYGPMAARAAGVQKIICAIRGLGSAFLPQATLKGKLLRAAVSRLYRRSCRLSHRVWFTNPQDLQFFLDLGLVVPDKVILTKNALNIQDFSPASVSAPEIARLRQELGLSPQDQVVVMVARMTWPKGIKEFVESSQILRRELPQARFILVGPADSDGPNAVPLEYLRTPEKAGNFRWLGFRKDVRELYALADLAVLPSFYKEGGYPRALLEPMALGKAVVTTDLTDCRGPVEEGKNGFLVPPRDSQALAEAIRLLLTDHDLRGRFGRYSRQKVEQEFDEKQVVKRIASELYASA